MNIVLNIWELLNLMEIHGNNLSIASLRYSIKTYSIIIIIIFLLMFFCQKNKKFLFCGTLSAILCTNWCKSGFVINGIKAQFRPYGGYLFDFVKMLFCLVFQSYWTQSGWYVYVEGEVIITSHIELKINKFDYKCISSF